MFPNSRMATSQTARASPEFSLAHTQTKNVMNPQ